MVGMIIGIVLLGCFIAIYQLAKDCAPCTDPMCCPQESPECIVCAHGGSYDHMNIEPGAINYVCRPHLYMPASKAKQLQRVDMLTDSAHLAYVTLKAADISERNFGRAPALDAVEALREQGAGDAYMNRVKAELCGPFGKMMP